MKRHIFLLILLPVTLFSKGWTLDPVVEAKIDSVMQLMTLDEKIGQMTQGHYYAKDAAEAAIRQHAIGSFLNIPHDAGEANRLQRIAVEETRLGIPLLFGLDVIHGFRTMFPIPLAESASWDLEGIRQSAEVAAREAAAAGVHWTFAPMMDIARDPRWGRIAEGAGEDPWLGAAIAKARVQGFQGDDVSAPDRLIACAKHYAAYGAAEGGRDYNTVDISERTLRNVYLPPFKAAVDAGAGTFMSAFNDLNGVPATGNGYLLTDILRNEWGFEGFVVSDWKSILEMVNHGFAEDSAAAALKAITAGVDMDMVADVYLNHLKELVERGAVPETLIDQSVRRILRLKFMAGLFDNPYADESLQDKVMLTPEHRAIARKVAGESIVLLKNENSLLPIRSDVRTLAVVGPLAESKRDLMGCWSASANPDDAVSILDGIRERAGDRLKITCSKGCDISSNDRSGFEKAVQTVQKSDLTIVVLGEGTLMSGEGYSRSDLGLPGVQLDLLKAIQETGKPFVLMLLAGRPLAIPWCAENAPAILLTWQLGLEHGHAAADVLFGDVNPSGKLTVSFPRATGQVPVYYNHLNTGRPRVRQDRFLTGYGDLDITPQYPFGFGLSYTAFDYEDLHLSADQIASEDSLIVTARIKNSGEREGEEIVQLYIRDIISSVTRPVKELKGFRKILLEKGETKTVRFVLKSADLGYDYPGAGFKTEPGEFKIWIGPNSQEGLEGTFRVTGE